MEHQEQDNRRIHREVEFRTVVKEKRESERPETLLQTPSLARRHHYRPSNLKLISQHYHEKLEELQSNGDNDHLSKNSQVQFTFVIVARIKFIHYQSNRYYLILSDETNNSSEAKFYYTKSHQPATLNNFVKTNRNSESERVEELQFEPTQEDGHSYFRLWLRLTSQRRKQSQLQLCWSVQRLQRIVHFDFLTYHWMCILMDRLRKH